MPGAAGASFSENAGDVPAGVFTVTLMAPLDGNSSGTSTLIWPPEAASAKMGAGVVPNRTVSPFTVVEGNELRLSCEPKFAPNIDTNEPGAAVPDEAKLAPLSNLPMAGAVPTGRVAVLLFTPPTVRITGSTPTGALDGTKKASALSPAVWGSLAI